MPGLLSIAAVEIWLGSSACCLRSQQLLLTCPECTSTTYEHGVLKGLTTWPSAWCPYVSPILVFSLEEEVVGKLYDACKNSSRSSAVCCTHRSICTKAVRWAQFGVSDLTGCGSSVLALLPIKSSDGLRLQQGGGVAL